MIHWDRCWSSWRWWEMIKGLSHRSSGEMHSFPARGESFRMSTPQVSWRGSGKQWYRWGSTAPNSSPKSMSPFSSCSSTNSELPLEMWKWISGCWLRSWRPTRANSRTISVSPAPMYTSPTMASSEQEISSWVRLTREKISSARLRKIIPSSVRVTFREPLVPRMSSCFPSSSSRPFSWVERVGWERCSDCAAPEMLCSRATAKK